jgi:hypothetical protein
LEYIAKLWRDKNDVAEYLYNHTVRLLKAGKKEYCILLLEAAIESKNFNEAILTLHDECMGTRSLTAQVNLNVAKKYLTASPPPIPPPSEGEGQGGGARGTGGEVA